MSQAPLRLKAMTLRGIGPYLHGARLEIQPLTILCGTNGSGKSTWFKALNLLRGWHEGGTFPFPPPDYGTALIGGHSREAHDLTNALVRRLGPNEEWRYAKDDDESYGPPGTIGLEFESAEAFVLPIEKSADEVAAACDAHPAQDFFWNGRVPNGIGFRLRVSHPSIWEDTADDFFGSLVELKVGAGIIQLRRDFNADDFGGDPAKIESYDFLCSKTLLPHSVGIPSSIAGLCRFEQGTTECGSLRLIAVSLIRGLLGGLLNGFFYLGAIRDIHEYWTVAESKEQLLDAVKPNRRSVGARGERTFLLESVYAYNEMRPSEPPFSGWLPQHFTAEQIGSDLRKLGEILCSPASALPTPLQQRYLASVSDSAKQRVIDSWIALNSRATTDGAAFGEDPEENHEAAAALRELEAERDDATASLLNELLDRDDLFNARDWPVEEPIKESHRADFNAAFAEFYTAAKSVTIEDRVSLPTLAKDARQIFAAMTAANEAASEIAAPNTGTTDGPQNDILKLFWYLMEITLPSEPAHLDTGVRWLRLLRAVIDTCSTDDRLAHLSLRLTVILQTLIDGAAPGSEARALIAPGVEQLHRQDRLRLNRLLLEAVFCDLDSSWSLSRKEGFVFDSQVSYWLERLLDIAMEGPELGLFSICTSGRDLHWSEGVAPPMGTLVRELPMIARLFHPLRWQTDEPGFAAAIGIHSECGPPDLQRFAHACFGPRRNSRFTEIAPALLSSGFHQVCPMVVQVTLMQKGELFAIENPEVHLHPALQLKVAEFLIEHAKSGRLLVIETHSDLIIRRVLRAILEERMGQEQIRIYFTGLADGPEGYKCATLERLGVNDEGRIINWPEGFLDADVRESKRLLDIMYGATRDGEDDERGENAHEDGNGE